MVSLTCHLQSEDSWADTYGRSLGLLPQVSQKWCHPVRTISHGPLCAVCYTLLHKKHLCNLIIFLTVFGVYYWGLEISIQNPVVRGQGHLWISSNAKDTPTAITPEYPSCRRPETPVKHMAELGADEDVLFRDIKHLLGSNLARG